MKRKDAEQIINQEQLYYYSFFENRDAATDEMVIKMESGRWIVYATDERAAKVTAGEAVFDNEEDALDNFIRRLRSLNKIRRIRNNGIK